MPLPAAITLCTILVCLVTMMATRISPDLILLAGVLFLAGVQILPADVALDGFANTGMLTVAALFVVAEGLFRTGAIGPAVRTVLGRSSGARRAILRMAGPVVGLSAFLNNTTIVASMVQPVQDWARRSGIPASSLLMPLSFLSILGGTVTLIGTSTNLVVAGLVSDAAATTEGLSRLKLFDITWVGLPAAVAGTLTMVLLSRWLFPHRDTNVTRDVQRYTVELRVGQKSRLVGVQIDEADFDRLAGSELIRIHREASTVEPDPDTVLRAGDRLLFRADLDGVLDLEAHPDLLGAPEVFKHPSQTGAERVVVEAVIHAHSTMVDHPISTGLLRRRYGAIVMAVARAGSAPRARLSDVILHPGDVLLLEVGPEAIGSARARADFVLIAPVHHAGPRRVDRAIVAVVILLALVFVMATGILPTVVAAFLAAGAMVLSTCCTAQEARRAIDLQVLVAISASFGLGAAMQVTGLDAMLAEGLLRTVAAQPISALVALYIITALLTESITNNAAAVLMFPVALALAAQQQVSPMPYVIVIMMAASASFLTPVGYQTNLMVMGPGGYRTLDYLRAGLPLAVVVGTVTLFATMTFFPF